MVQDGNEDGHKGSEEDESNQKLIHMIKQKLDKKESQSKSFEDDEENEDRIEDDYLAKLDAEKGSLEGLSLGRKASSEITSMQPIPVK